MPGRETVLVTGATGTVGRALMGELVELESLTVRALSRNPAASVPAGVELQVGDFSDAPSLDRAMGGVTRLFLVTSGTQIAEQDAATVSAARRAGVGHIVKLSALGVGRGGTDPITAWHRAGEQQVRSSGLGWTILRPTGFMTNALEWVYSIRASGTVFAPFADGRTALIDPHDIARVAAATLAGSGHCSQTYDLTGPDPLSPGDQVRILSEVVGMPITYAEIDPDVARRRLEQYGMTPDLADAVIQLLASAREPWNGQPLPDVQAVTGHSPTDFRTWASAHRNAFTSAQ